LFADFTDAARRAPKALRVAATVAVCIGALCSPLRGADEQGGTTSPFSLGAGGRVIAMGGAGAALCSDSYALLWNPAGLYRIERDELNLFHTSLFDESSTYSSLILAHPFVELGVFSLGVVQLRVDGIERRDANNMVLGGEFKNVQTRFLLGYARDLVKGFAVGASLKLDRYAEDSYVANGFGIDAGIRIEPSVHSPVFDGMSLGLSVANILEPAVRLVEQQVGDPRAMRAGVSFWRPVSRSLNDRLTVSVDVDKARLSDTRFHAGAEYRLRNTFAMRAGWDAGIPTFGCGFMLPFLQFDYAYRSTELGGNHLFSLSCRFGASRSERAELARARREQEIHRELDIQINDYEDAFVAKALENGQTSLKEKNYEAARDHFGRVLLWSPANETAKMGMLVANSSILMLTGDSLMAQGNLAEALLSYREASRELQSPQASERIKRCEQQIRRAADNERTKHDMLARAVELYTDRQWADAAAGFEEVLALDPRNELASGYLSKARDRIRESYERTLAEADRLGADGRYGAALQLLKTELEKTPRDARIEAKIRTVEALRTEAAARKNRAAAAPAARALGPDELAQIRASYDRGVESFKRGDFAGAIEEWEGVRREYSEFEEVAGYLVKAYQYLGMEYYARHEYEKALETWNKILVVDPDNEKALRYIQKTKEELSKLEGLTTR
jgi:tetratricopeptide (TPR) repeat protein